MRIKYLKNLIVLFSLALMFCCGETKNKQTEIIIETDSAVIKKEIPTLYGIPTETYHVSNNIIPRDKNISDILKPYGVEYKQSIELSKRADSIFDVRSIKSGNPYTVFQQKDSAGSLSYFVYAVSIAEYIVFKLEDTLDVWKYNKPIVINEVKGTGTIETSLWNCMIANNLPPTLALDLSEIYAWSIDFFGLQQGDHFTVVYDEKRVDTMFAGISRVKYAVFNHMGENFYAIPFEQDSVLSFYDEKGQSLRKAFLKAPLNFSRISSRFSNSRLHPVLKIRRPHHGVDYAAPVGTPVYAIGDGIVVKRSYSDGAGNWVKIKHNGTYSTAYLHLSKFGKGIAVGSRVQQGQVIGFVGSSGLSTGPHLDFRFYKNGAPVDPLKVEAPPVDPVKSENIDHYTTIKDSLIMILKN